MNVRNLLTLLGWLTLLLASAPARATVNLQVCIQVDTDFGPNGLGAGVEWIANAPRDLRGVKIKLEARTPCSGTQAEFADWTGADKGCHTFAVNPACNYDVRTLATILVDGVTVRVLYGTEAVSALQERLVEPNDDPPVFDSTVTFDFPPPGAQGGGNKPRFARALAPGGSGFPSDDAYRWLAVAGHMFQKSTLGLSPTTFDIYPDLASGVPVPQDDGDIYGKATEKFLLAHEFGHAIANRIEGHDVSFSTSCGTWDIRDGNGNGLPAENNCRAEIGATASKSMFSIEYDAMSAREGWADFIAAWTWNDPTESNCTHGRWGAVSDFDLDDDAAPTGLTIADADNKFAPAGWVSCEGIPITPATCSAWGATCLTPFVPLQSYVTARDWVEDLTTASDVFGCTSNTLVNRSSTADWMRFFWDLRTDENVSMAAIAELWDNLDMSTVDPDDNTTGSCASVGTSDDVYARLHTYGTGAKYTTTCGGTPTNCVDEVDAQADNGQDHMP